jgi:hypothetical protein
VSLSEERNPFQDFGYCRFDDSARVSTLPPSAHRDGCRFRCPRFLTPPHSMQIDPKWLTNHSSTTLLKTKYLILAIMPSEGGRNLKQTTSTFHTRNYPKDDIVVGHRAVYFIKTHSQPETCLPYLMDSQAILTSIAICGG